jgi:hypothetical protein
MYESRRIGTLRVILNITPGPQGWNLSPRGNVHPFVHSQGMNTLLFTRIEGRTEKTEREIRMGLRGRLAPTKLPASTPASLARPGDVTSSLRSHGSWDRTPPGYGAIALKNLRYAMHSWKLWGNPLKAKFGALKVLVLCHWQRDGGSAEMLSRAWAHSMKLLGHWHRHMYKYLQNWITDPSRIFFSTSFANDWASARILLCVVSRNYFF